MHLTPRHRASRRAELFARALDGEHVDDAATQALVGVAGRLSALQIAAPSPAARTAARTALVAAAGATAVEVARHAATTGALHAAASHTAAQTAVAAGKTGLFAALAHSAALAAATGAAVVAVGAGAVGVGAHRSLPGDPFYGVKRTAESVRLDLAGSAQDKARVRLSHAQARLDEVRALWPRTTSDAHTAQIASLVGSLDHDVALATQPLLAGGAAQLLATTVTGLQTSLAALPHTLTGSGADAVATSVALLGTLSTTVTAVPSVVPGVGPTGVAPTAPTLPVQVAPTGSGGSLGSGAPAPSASTTAPRGGAGSGASAPASAPGVLPSGLPSVLPSLLPSAPVSVPVSIPVPAPVGSLLPTPVASAVCGLLQVGGVCPAS